MKINSPINAKLEDYNGRPTIMLNGTPVNPMLYALTDTPGGRWSWEELPQRQLQNFTDANFSLYQVSIWLQDIWEKGKPLNIALVRKLIAGVLEVNPEGAIMLRLHINAPFWWNEENPEECTEYADGPSLPHDENIGVHRYIIGDLDRRSLHSLASLKWRQETTEILKEFCDKLGNTPEGERLIALQFCDGVSHEWHYWGFIEHEPDCGKAMETYFRNWLKDKYKNDKELQTAWCDSKVSLTTAKVPGMEYRAESFQGIFRDPEKERRIIDYYMCQHDSIAEDIIHFGKVLKENWPRPVLTGTFYGYFFMMFSRQAIGGHLVMEKILNCKDIDFLCAPFSYWGDSRPIGGSGQARGVIDSCRLHGKLWFNEMDQETQIKSISILKNNSILECNEMRDFLEKGVPEDIALIKRNTIQPYCNRAAMWYFDFGPLYATGWWDFPDYLATIKDLKKIIDHKYNEVLEDITDVLVVYDTDCYYYVKPGWSPISQSSIDDFSGALHRTGVAFDSVYIFDLEKMDLTQYKVIIFANPWLLTKRQKLTITNKVKKQKKHIVWNYLPGYIDGNKCDINFTCEVTGIKVEEIALEQTPEIKMRNGFPSNNKLQLQGDRIYPFPKIVDEEVEVYGTLNETNRIGLCKKEFSDHTSWYCTIPLKDEKVLREIFKLGGVHIYNEEDEVTICGGGIVAIHTLEGGTRKITLKNKMLVTLTLEPKSTTLIDAATGEVLI